MHKTLFCTSSISSSFLSPHFIFRQGQRNMSHCKGFGIGKACAIYSVINIFVVNSVWTRLPKKTSGE